MIQAAKRMNTPASTIDRGQERLAAGTIFIAVAFWAPRHNYSDISSKGGASLSAAKGVESLWATPVPALTACHPKLIDLF